MTRRLVSVLLVLSVTSAATERDAGTTLTAAECGALLDVMMQVAVTEALAADAEFKKMPADQRAATEKMARQQALTDAKLDELKTACPKRYTQKQRACILGAKSMAEIDACSKS